MNTNTGEIRVLSAPELERMQPKERAAWMPLSIQDHAKLKGMSRRERRAWARDVRRRERAAERASRQAK